MLQVLTGTTLRAALAGTLLWVAGASVAAWAAPEATGTFEKIPLEKEVDDRFWFVQNQYQDNSERVRPSRKQKKGWRARSSAPFSSTARTPWTNKQLRPLSPALQTHLQSHGLRGSGYELVCALEWV